MDHQIIVQLIGFVAVAISFLVYQFNSRKTMLLIQIVSALTFVIHFFLLGAITGAAMNIFSVVRSSVFYKLDKKRNVTVLLALITLLIILTALSWRGTASLLPFAGSLIGLVAFYQLQPRRIRFIVLSGPCFWFAYNFISGSYAGMTADFISLSSILLGIYRFDVYPVLKRQPKAVLQKSKS